MKPYRIWILVLVLLTLSLLPGHETGAAPPPKPRVDFAPGELLIKFESGLSAQSAMQALRPYGASRDRALYKSPIELWRVPEGEELALAEKLSALPQVAYAEPNYVVRALETVPNDPRYNRQWAHKEIMHSPQGWDITTGSADIIIAVLDSGIDAAHPDLADKLVPGYDFVDNDSNPHDLNGHGTHVAGIAAAATNNGIGIAGTSWGARIMPIRVLDAEGSGYDSDIIEGLNWAANHGADIINLSLGGPGYNQSAQDAVNNVHAQGILIVAAMGNCREQEEPYCPEANPTLYPAAYDNVMAVAATGPDDVYASYSQYGPHCDIAAPGGDILTSWSQGIYSTMPTYDVYLTTNYGYYKNYDYLNGTSQATPHVAGLAALIWSLDPTLTPDQVQSLMEENAVDRGTAGWDEDYGHGRIDLGATLQALDVLGAPTLDPISNPDEDGEYVLSWSGDPDATEYRLQEDDNSDFTSPHSLYLGSDTQYTVTQQPAGIWYYRVQASNANGESPWSNVVSTTIRPTAPVLNPIENAAQEDAYTVIWSAVGGAQAYTLQEAATVGFTNAVTRYVGSETHYEVTGQDEGTWYYRVHATASTGDSDWSHVVSTTVAPSTLEPPTLQAIANDDEDGDYTVAWSAVPSATTYTLEESPDGYFTAPTTLYNGANTSFNVTGRNPGTWHYRVRAHSATDSSPWSLPQAAYVGPLNVYLPLVMRNYGPTTLRNGDFESGSTGWVQYSSNGFSLIMDATDLPTNIPPHGGQWAAWLGGANDEISYVEQAITVKSQRPYLTYWRWVISEDVCGFDHGYVLFAGDTVEQHALCEDTSTGSWARHSVDLSEYVGQRSLLRFQATTDSTLLSNLFIDDVALSESLLPDQAGAPSSRPPTLPTKDRR
ncbi:MAG: S8 family serine peptidase [Anaerolineae bacterium]